MTQIMDNSARNDCFTWIEDLVDANATTTLQDLNYFFLKRNLGGIIFISIMMVIGFFGNVSVVWIYATKFNFTNFRTYTLWLASLDLANCCLGMPFLLVYHTHYLTFPDVTLCKAGRYVMVFSANASAILLVVIAIDRYVHVCKPSKMTSISKNKTIAGCFVAAGVGALISLPAIPLFGNHTVNNLPVHINTSAIRCWEEDRHNQEHYLGLFYVFMSAFSFLVTIILFVIYSLILRFIYKYKISNRTEHTKKITAILFSVTLAYVISALPHNVILVVLFDNPDFQCGLSFTEGFVLYIVVWSNLVNNAVNPVIYGYSDAKFRQEFKSDLFNLCGKFQVYNRASISVSGSDTMLNTTTVKRYSSEAEN